MMDAKTFHTLQAKANLSIAGVTQDEFVSFEDYLAVCRKYIQNSLPENYYTQAFGGSQEREDLMNNLISEFIDVTPKRVKGYINHDGTIDIDRLASDLSDQVQGLGILKTAFLDPEIDEIQINDYKTIFVSRKGVLEPYMQPNGTPYMFNSNEEILSLLNRIVNDGTGTAPTINPGNPIFNAKTAKEQYRINAVHPVANTINPNSDVKEVTSVVIRKFKEVKLHLEDLVEYGTVTDKMAHFIELIGRAEVKIFCVGPTGSGKTTLLNIIANVLPVDKRVILVQNPTEITIFDNDNFGRNRRNIVHWEVYDDGSKDMGANKASMENLISNTLRATPEVIIVGESRAPGEFEQLQRASMTGHRVLSTFHAEDEYDATSRFASELASATHSTQGEAKAAACRTMDIIITQYRFSNGERRIMSISETIGFKDGEPIFNNIFRYRLTGEVKIDERNGIACPVGVFEYNNPISERLEQYFYKAGISRDEIAPYLKDGYKRDSSPYFDGGDTR